MNILILSAGTRNKIVQYFKRELNGKGNIIATDASIFSPAIYDADKYYIVPLINDPGYIETIFKICKIEKISGIFSLIDPELTLLARYEDNFKSIGTTVIGSPYQLCDTALDKYKMYKWFVEHGYRCAQSWIDKEEFFYSLGTHKINFPVFVKPINGSASNNISKVYNKEAIDLIFSSRSNMMIQEFLDGQEIGVDVYVDMITGEVTSIFTKKKLKMRAGETDKSVSFKDKLLFNLIENFVLEAGCRGVVDIDIFKINGDYYFSEVNPRFGGGYPHAYESGCNFIKLIIENIKGCKNIRNIGNYGEDIYMMKYNEVKVINGC